MQQEQIETRKQKGYEIAKTNRITMGTKTRSQHNPNLKTIISVENAIKKSNQPIKRVELKKKLKKQIMHQTLNTVLAYLEKRNMILDTHKGIIWLDEPSKKLLKALKQGTHL